MGPKKMRSDLTLLAIRQCDAECGDSLTFPRRFRIQPCLQLAERCLYLIEIDQVEREITEVEGEEFGDRPHVSSARRGSKAVRGDSAVIE